MRHVSESKNGTGVGFPQRWFLVVVATVASMAQAASAGDWPMWRYDAGRTASSPNSLAPELHLKWQRQYTQRQQVWDDPLNHDLMTYDRIFEPIVKDGRVFIGFNDADKLVAFDVETGRQLWTFYADGPVRLSPVAWKDSVLFASDDGHLYSVDARDGTLRWKFRGAPSARKVIGNRRMVSAWPARGGPVIADDMVYFAASIWPFMGTFIYALDAETGKVVWLNDRTAADYIQQPHSAPSFAGVAPQGSMVVSDDYLLVPGGRSVPAAFDRQTGELRYFHLNSGGKGTGGSLVMARNGEFFVHTRVRGVRAFDLKSGNKTEFMTNEPVLSQTQIFAAEIAESKDSADESTPVIRAYNQKKELLWEVSGVNGSGDLIRAGERLYAAGGGELTVLELQEDGRGAKVVQRLPTAEQVLRLVAAHGHLLAVSLDGRILAYGPDRVDEPIVHQQNTRPLWVPERHLAESEELENLTHWSPGYVVWFGLEHPALLQSLVSSTRLQIVAVDDDEEVVQRLRQGFDDAGVYGRRISLHHGSIDTFMAPPYVAQLVVIDLAELPDAEQLRRAYETVRPYGGKLVVLDGSDESVSSTLRDLELENAHVSSDGEWTVAERVGALTGAANWTHQYGDVANTVKSNDRRVKLPLGLLWFGGSSNLDVLPRHGHGPPEQVVDGRLYIQGMNSLSCRDVYTGQVLWHRDFDNLGTYDVYYDETYKNTPLNPAYNQVHIPGANGRGTNYVATEDAVYIVEADRCHVLSIETGKTLRQIVLPRHDDRTVEWGYIGVYQDVLLAGSGFADYARQHSVSFEDTDGELKGNSKGFGSNSLDKAASRALVAFDRHSGKVLWQRDADFTFLHNGIVAGDELVYCLDKLPQPVEERLRRRGQAKPDNYRIVAFDIRSGELVWQQVGDIFGTWLGYSEPHQLLLHAGAAASDRLRSEVGQGMAVYYGQTGELKWRVENRSYSGPCILYHDTILTNANSYQLSSGAYSLLDGTPKKIINPLTLEEQPWQICRTYGCNNIIASENLLTFRSGAAGYYDLLSKSGTGNLGGFKSGCTSNLVVANGVLNAPDYTRTCSCAYQNQTSLGLIHMPELDMWAVNHIARLSNPGDHVKRLGVNFGAPGDRIEESGTLWIDYPPVGGDSPDLLVDVNGADVDYYRHHTLAFQGPEPPWIGASGVEGFDSIRIPLRISSNDSGGMRFYVRSANDDAEEQADGSVSLGSSDLELVTDDEDQVVGIRFESVDISRDAEILEAYLQFTCDETSTDETKLTVALTDEADARPFASKERDISSRPLRETTVQWEPDAWDQLDRSGPVERSPDLTELVRGLIERPDWKPGNAMVFVIRGHGKRVAKAFKGSREDAPQLVIQTKEGARRAEPEPAARHLVRLYFSEPADSRPGERVFDLTLQNQVVESGLDLAALAGVRSTIVREYRDVMIGEALEISVNRISGSPILSGVEIIRTE